MSERKATVNRETLETQITVSINLMEPANLVRIRGSFS